MDKNVDSRMASINSLEHQLTKSYEKKDVLDIGEKDVVHMEWDANSDMVNNQRKQNKFSKQPMHY